MFVFLFFFCRRSDSRLHRRVGQDVMSALSVTVTVIQGVIGAFVVAGTGTVAKARRLVPEGTGATVAKLIYWIIGPLFAFNSIGRVSIGLPHLLVAVGALSVVTSSFGVGLLVLLAWGSLPATNRVVVLMMTTFSNVGSLPLFLAQALPYLQKPDIFSYLVVYIATQSLLMWGIFFPAAMVYLSRVRAREAVVEMAAVGDSGSPQPTPTPEAPLKVLQVVGLVFNPSTVGVLAGIGVSAIPALQRFVFASSFTLVANVARTLGDMNVGAHLLILGLGLFPLHVETAWPLVLVASLVRLVLVPSVIFTLFAAVAAATSFSQALPLEPQWVALTLASTPPNLGILVIADRLQSRGAAQALLLSYILSVVTVPFFNSCILYVLQ